jgi:hypothetical protein
VLSSLTSSDQRVSGSGSRACSAQARLGVVPQSASDKIDAAARSIKVDFKKLRHETENVGYATGNDKSARELADQNLPVSCAQDLGRFWSCRALACDQR